MNENALLNRIIVLEEYCLDLIGGLPPNYTPLGSVAKTQNFDNHSEEVAQPPTSEDYITACSTGG